MLCLIFPRRPPPLLRAGTCAVTPPFLLAAPRQPPRRPACGSLRRLQCRLPHARVGLRALASLLARRPPQPTPRLHKQALATTPPPHAPDGHRAATPMQAWPRQLSLPPGRAPPTSLAPDLSPLPRRTAMASNPPRLGFALACSSMAAVASSTHGPRCFICVARPCRGASSASRPRLRLNPSPADWSRPPASFPLTLLTGRAAAVAERGEMKEGMTWKGHDKWVPHVVEEG
ncbi:hypothetical protein BS78_03G069900 [Paspalum vaginatum]|nr:hypothetical protein BS78_03G069900 [Paspalum vaginatum]